MEQSQAFEIYKGFININANHTIVPVSAVNSIDLPLER